MYLRSFFLEGIIHLMNYAWREKTQSGSLRSTQAVRKPSTTKSSEISAKHAPSDMSSESETSFESRHLTDELDSIKRQLLEIPTKKDIEPLREWLVGTDEFKTLVTDSVKVGVCSNS